MSDVSHAHADLTPKARGKRARLVLEEAGPCAGPRNAFNARRRRRRSGRTGIAPAAMPE